MRDENGHLVTMFVTELITHFVTSSNRVDDLPNF
jgi:hypothetical protein